MKKALLVLLLFSAFMFVLPAASDAAIQQDTDGYYLLATSSDLKEFKELVDSGYLIAKGKLTNDIVLSSDKAPCDWTEVGPIGPSGILGKPDREFLGILDGQGYAIKGLYVKETSNKFNGFICKLGIGGIVKNLTITGTFETGNSTSGVIVGKNYGEIINCTNMANLTVKGAAIVGGISGQNYGSIINCFNSGAIIGGDSSTGGIAGILSSNCSIINCVNTGNVTGKHDNTAGIAPDFCTYTPELIL